MKVNGAAYRSIWLNSNGWSADIIDQTRLPHEFVIKTLSSMHDAAEAISVMRVRGAPLIGATAAYANGIASQSPGLRGTSYPGTKTGNVFYPIGVASPGITSVTRFNPKHIARRTRSRGVPKTHETPF